MLANLLFCVFLLVLPEVLFGALLIFGGIAWKIINKKVKMMMCVTLVLLLCASSASATESVNVAKDVVKGGIQSAIVSCANSCFDFGISDTQNLTENQTASQRLVVGLGGMATIRTFLGRKIFFGHLL
jgi:hypothetical protein